MFRYGNTIIDHLTQVYHHLRIPGRSLTKEEVNMMANIPHLITRLIYPRDSQDWGERLTQAANDILSHFYYQEQVLFGPASPDDINKAIQVLRDYLKSADKAYRYFAYLLLARCVEHRCDILEEDIPGFPSMFRRSPTNVSAWLYHLADQYWCDDFERAHLREKRKPAMQRFIDANSTMHDSFEERPTSQEVSDLLKGLAHPTFGKNHLDALVMRVRKLVLSGRVTNYERGRLADELLKFSYPNKAVNALGRHLFIIGATNFLQLPFCHSIIGGFLWMFPRYAGTMTVNTISYFPVIYLPIMLCLGFVYGAYTKGAAYVDVNEFRFIDSEFNPVMLGKYSNTDGELVRHSKRLLSMVHDTIIGIISVGLLVWNVFYYMDYIKHDFNWHDPSANENMEVEEFFKIVDGSVIWSLTMPVLLGQMAMWSITSLVGYVFDLVNARATANESQIQDICDIEQTKLDRTASLGEYQVSTLRQFFLPAPRTNVAPPLDSRFSRTTHRSDYGSCDTNYMKLEKGGMR